MNNYPVKKVKYSGTVKVRPGDFMVWMPDGTVKAYKEAVAGVATNENGGEQEEIEFYIPKETNNE